MNNVMMDGQEKIQIKIFFEDILSCLEMNHSSHQLFLSILYHFTCFPVFFRNLPQKPLHTQMKTVRKTVRKY